jgi:hypothetical protein
MGNSNYNALKLTLKRTKGALTLLASYSFSKSLDWSSNLQEQVDPYNYRKQYGISHFDIKHNLVASYFPAQNSFFPETGPGGGPASSAETRKRPLKRFASEGIS